MVPPPDVGNLQTNIHQIGNTVAWSLLFNISIICVIFKHDKRAQYAHSILGFGFIILAMTYGDILQILVPFGFNISVSANGVPLEIHAIIGILMLVLVVIQVGGGLYTRFTQSNQQAKSLTVISIKKYHKGFGYAMAIIYKINIILAWFRSPLFYVLIVWELVFIGALIYLKVYYPLMQKTIVDTQIADGESISKVGSKKQIEQLTQNVPFIIFNSYIYTALPLKTLHPGGYEVIKTIENREVDRFIYGMYSSELLPELLPHSHKERCLRILGMPIGKYEVPNTYSGFSEDLMNVRIQFKTTISEKTQIFLLGLVPKESNTNEFEFNSYTDIRQLGQYYSLTINNQTTRLYTAVNFSIGSNIKLMNGIFKEKVMDEADVELISNLEKENKKVRISQLTDMNQTMIKNAENISSKTHKEFSEMKYLPVMLKIYKDGKLTSQLKSHSFDDINLQISKPKGRGLELSETRPGRIVILAGGTGLFPFSDLLDLLFKSHLIKKQHQQSKIILKLNPILLSRPFEKYTFVLMIALNEPEDLHPITLKQLVELSNISDSVRIILRVSKNEKDLLQLKSKIVFTREYFDAMTIKECKAEGFSRLWVCGPPKMSTSAAKSMLESGYSKEDILLV